MSDLQTLALPNIKKLILPDIGMEIADADYSGADAMIVAADSECKWLLDFFANSKDKLYAYIASSHLQREITSSSPEYKAYKAVCHGCVTDEHEVLTENGWVSFKNLQHNIPIACWENGEIFFDVPIDYTISPYEGDLYLWEGKTAIFGTPNHRQIVYDTRRDEYKVYTLESLPNTGNLRIINSGIKQSGDSLDLNFLRLLVAVQADGTWKTWKTHKGYVLGFNLKKQRKIDRLEYILQQLNVEYNKALHSNGVTYISFDEEINKEVFSYLGPNKILPNYLLSLGQKEIATILNELDQWDGTRNIGGSIAYSTTVEKNAILIQTLGSLNGYYSSLQTSKVEGKKDLYRVTLSKTNGNSCRQYTKQATPFKGEVYCVTVSSSYFLTRYKNKIMVTGNSNYGLGIPKLARMLNISEASAQELQDFYFDLCPEIKLWHNRIKKEIADNGYISNIFGRRGWFLNKNDVTLYNKAFAFIPQSTIADLINHGIVNIYEKYPEIQVLMQVHDSAVCQYPIEKKEIYRKAILECLTIELPYNPPLIIPADMKVSTISYGDCEKIKKVA